MTTMKKLLLIVAVLGFSTSTLFAQSSTPVPVLMPIDNDIDALRSVIWLETDQKYKAAVERFIQVKANRTIKVDEEDTSADLSRESKQTAVLPLAAVDVDVRNWEDRLKTYSA